MCPRSHQALAAIMVIARRRITLIFVISTSQQKSIMQVANRYLIDRLILIIKYRLNVQIPEDLFSSLIGCLLKEQQQLNHNYKPIQMRITKGLRFDFARKGLKNQASYQQTANAKLEYLKKYSRRLQSDEKFQHQDILYEEFVYGHTIHIGGLTPYNFQSLKFAKSVMDFSKPNLLILGGLSDNYLRYFQQKLGIRHFYEHPMYKPQKMMCKQRLSRYIQARLEADFNFNWNEQKKELISIDESDKRIQPNDYLTVAHIASFQPETRVALGRPSDTVVLQDLIMRYSVEQLKAIAERAIQKVQERRGKQTEWAPSFTRQAIRNYVMSEQPEVYSRELTYQAALLKRYAKVTDKILMLLPGYFVERIASQVHQIDIKPEKVYRDGMTDPNSQSYALLQKILRENDPQSILQKFALLVLIRQSWIENQFARGTNVFKHMCFGQLFSGMDMQQLYARYDKARQATETKWFELMHQRINNIHVQEGPHIKYTLAQQFKVLQERATKHFPYTYQEKNYMSIYEDRVKLGNLQQRMMDYLNAEGDKHRIQVFEALNKGIISKEGIILYSKLLGKMNVEMEDRLKLPVFHYGAFRGIYKEYLRDFLIRGHQSNKLDEKLQKRKTKTEQLMEQHMKKLDDPIELHKYITGQKGKALHLDFDPQDGPSFKPEDVQILQKMYGKMSPEDEMELRQQYGQDWDQLDEKDE